MIQDPLASRWGPVGGYFALSLTYSPLASFQSACVLASPHASAIHLQQSLGKGGGGLWIHPKLGRVCDLFLWRLPSQWGTVRFFYAMKGEPVCTSPALAEHLSTSADNQRTGLELNYASLAPSTRCSLQPL